MTASRHPSRQQLYFKLKPGNEQLVIIVPAQSFDPEANDFILRESGKLEQTLSLTFTNEPGTDTIAGITFLFGGAKRIHAEFSKSRQGLEARLQAFGNSVTGYFVRRDTPIQVYNGIKEIYRYPTQKL